METAGSTRETASAVREVRQETEQLHLTARKFVNSASLINTAYTQALSQVKSQLKSLGQQLSAVAAVGLNAFSTLLSGLQPLAKRLSELVTGLFGVKVWTSTTKAAEGTASALNKAAKSAKSAAKAQKELYSFDEITRVTASSSGGSSAGGSSGSVRGSSAADEVTKYLVTVEGTLTDLFAKIWEPFQKGWESEGRKVTNAAKAALTEIGDTLSAIGQSWLNVWTNGTGEQAVTTVLQIVRELLDSVGSLAEGIREAWNSWNKGERIIQNLADGVQNMLDHIRNMAAATAEWAEGLNFNGLVRGFLRVTDALEPLTDLIGGALSWGYTNVLLPLGKWVIEESGPAALNLLSDAIKALTSMLNGLAPIGQDIWNNLLQPLGSWTCDLLVTGLELVRQGFQNLTNVFSGLPEKWQQLKNNVTAIWSSLTGSLTTSTSSCQTSLMAAFDGIGSGLQLKLSNMKTALTPIWSGFTGSLTASASDCKTGLMTVFESIGSGLQQKLSNMKTALASIWSSFTAGLSTSADSCKTNLVNIFSGISSGIQQKLSNLKTALTTPFKNGLNAVIDLVNKVINKINSALKFSWDPIKVMGQTIAPGGSVTLAKISTISKLAEGGIVTAPTFSLVGEAGREAVLPLERNTGWMDELAGKLAERMGGSSGELVVEVHVGNEKLTSQVVQDVNRMTRQNGRCPIYV